MEKWKIAVIVLLIAALGGYGFYQQNPATTTPDETTPVATPMPSKQKLLKLKGQAPPSWNFDRVHWLNTPQPITPADVKGYVTFIEFWRTGCSHCEESIPFMNKLFTTYSPRGVKFIAIHSPGAPDSPAQPNPENNWGEVQQFAKEHGIKYPVAFDEGGVLFKQQYGGATYPTMMIVDKSGKVAFIQTGHTPDKEVAVRAALEKELKRK